MSANFEPVLRMVAGLDRDEDRDAEPDLVLIDQATGAG
jgi:hypothetical protein